MLEVKVSCTNCLGDYALVNRILAELNVRVLSQKVPRYSIYPIIMILVNDYDELNQILNIINSKLIYGVKIQDVRIAREKLLYKLILKLNKQ